jgi:IMP dehydrogenase/GMP reductase
MRKGGMNECKKNKNKFHYTKKSREKLIVINKNKCTKTHEIETKRAYDMTKDNTAQHSTAEQSTKCTHQSI